MVRHEVREEDVSKNADPSLSAEDKVDKKVIKCLSLLRT